MNSNDALRRPMLPALIDRDATEGRRLGVPTTPTILVNDEKYAGLPRNLDTIIRTAAHRAVRN